MVIPTGCNADYITGRRTRANPPVSPEERKALNCFPFRVFPSEVK